MLTICKCLFDSMNQNNIRYCSFKSNEHLGEGLQGDTDLDILTAKEDYECLTEVFKKNRFIEFEPCHVGSYPNVVNWFGFDCATGKMIHVHLHFELMTGKGLVKEYCLPWGKLFLQKSVTEENTAVKIVQPQYEYVLLCTRSIIKRMCDLSIKIRKRKLSADVVRELDYLRARISDEEIRSALGEMYSESFCKQYGDEFLKIQELDSDRYYRLAKAVRKNLRKSQRMPLGIALITSLCNRTNRRICMAISRRMNLVAPVRKRCSHRAVSVAFVGVDGSGKSTVSSEIKKWLRKEFDVAGFYAGSGDGKKNILSACMLKLYGKKRKASRQKTGVLKTENMPKKQPWLKALGASVAYLRILKDNIRNLRKSQKLVRKGILCVMDRYPQNSLPGYHDGAKLEKYRTEKNAFINQLVDKEQKLLHSVKKYPYDLVLVMRVSAEVSYQRKPEESLESLRNKVSKLDAVSYDAGEVIRLDAEKPLEEVLLEVKCILWDKLFLN